MKLIDDTPFKSTLLRVRSHRGGHHKALPDAEVSRIKREIPALQDTRQRLYMALLVYTGMRREEVLGLGWENIHLDENYGEVKRVVVFPNNAKAVVKDSPKTETSERTFIIPAALKQILLPHQKAGGYVIHGEGEYSPVSYSTFQRTYYGAFKKLGIYGKYSNHDWRSKATNLLCMNHAQAQYRQQAKEQKIKNRIIHKQPKAFGTLYSEAIEDDTAAQDILISLEQVLRPFDYEIIKAYCIENKSMEEISQQTGISTAALRVRLHRIRQEIAKIFILLVTILASRNI